MKDTLLIIFVKNIVLGKVKTRLAKTIGIQGAFEVYKHIVAQLENETSKVNHDKHIYFSDVVIKEKWPKDQKFVQSEGDIGMRMKNAFEEAFNQGYKRVVLVGSDIPDLTFKIIDSAFDELENHKTVFGPSEEGGYYLVGLNEMDVSIFEGVEWSTEQVLAQSLNKVSSYALVEELNDIDTIDDLRRSSIADKFPF